MQYEISRRSEMRIRALLTCCVAVWLAICAFRPHLPVNPVSRLAAIESLVDRGTWRIDESRFTRMTVDKVQVDGHFYSSKPPLFLAIGAGTYWGVQQLVGLRFSDDVHGTTSVLRIFLGILPWLIGLLSLGSLLDRFVRDVYARIWVFASVAVGSLATAYASDISNHTPAWAAMLAAAAILSPMVHGPVSVARVVAGGLVAGLASALDLGAVPTVGAFGLLVFTSLLRERRIASALGFGAAGLTLPLIQLGLNVVISGSWRPFYLQAGAYTYPGSYWMRPAEFDALSENKLVYFFHETFGHHGVFATAPFLLLGAWYLLRHRETEKNALLLQRVALATVAFTWIYYTWKMSNYGGRAVGMRWFLVTEPALLLAMARYSDVSGIVRRRPVAVGALTGIAAVSILGGAINAWEEGFVYVLFQTLGWSSFEG